MTTPKTPESKYQILVPSVQIVSLTSVRIELFCGDVLLAIGTAFLDTYNGEPYLITNWHCVTGRHPFNGKTTAADGVTPDRLIAFFHRMLSGGSFAFHDPLKVEIPVLYRKGSNWLMHPGGQSVDVVAHKLQEDTKSLAHAFIRRITNAHEAIVQVGSEVSILGFPEGLTPTGSLPVWKRGSVATEPSAFADGEPCFWIDSATRKGMSGSPVFVRRPGTYRFDNPATGNIGKIGISDHLAFCGIYSGRMGESDPLEAQIGKVWRPDCIYDVVNSGIALDYIER